jgi:manganese transport protein
MTIAGLVNMAMLVMAAGIFHARGLTGVGDIDEAYRGLGTIVGGHADVIFGIALLASGLSSSSVGTLAGQVVMQGYINRQIPLYLRRIITMAPALIVLAIPAINPSSALVISQVGLSFGIPFALIPLVMFCRNRELMGDLVNRRATNLAAYAVVGVIVSLNVFLIYDTVLG